MKLVDGIFDYLSQRKWLAMALLAVLMLAAHLINLGLYPVTSDEPTRAIVAMEMMWSGNYITPTIFGEYYYNKPPLFNWILVLFYKVLGGPSEFATRLPTVISLFIFAAIIYHFSAQHLSRKWAFINAMAYVTCGRVLFWDSQLGLIDTTYSMLTFLMFMLIYQYMKREQWRQIILVAYFISSITFLMKGLPSLVFLGFTLLTVFIWKRKFLMLLGVWHLAGFSVLVAIVGSYYFLYHQHNDLTEVFPVLWDESIKRTAVEKGVGSAILHLFTFPFEMIYHFLPWTLLVVFLIRKGLMKAIRENEFVSYLCLVFVVNILPYWTSPQVYPRYLLMLIPLLFTVLCYFGEQAENARSKGVFTFKRSLVVLGAAVGVALLAVPFIPKTDSVNLLWPKVLGLSIAMFLIARWMYTQQRHTLWLFAVLLLVARLGFNWIVLPIRTADSRLNDYRQQCIQLGKQFADEPILNYYGASVYHFELFYICRERGATLRNREKKEPLKADMLYLIPRSMIGDFPHERLFTIQTKYLDRDVDLVRFKGLPE